YWIPDRSRGSVGAYSGESFLGQSPSALDQIAGDRPVPVVGGHPIVSLVRVELGVQIEIRLVGGEHGAGDRGNVPLLALESHQPFRLAGRGGDVVADPAVPFAGTPGQFEGDVVEAHHTTVLDDVDSGIVVDHVAGDGPA